MNIERALATPGWMSEVELVYLAHLAMKSHSILEVGSWRGRSARALADNSPGTVTCVDTWQDDAYGAVFDGDAPDLCQHPDWLWNEFQKNHEDTLRLGRVIPIRATSVEGAKILDGRTFDLIHIDAGHNYEDVRADILAWKPMLREGGILCGHDLYPTGPYHPGVLQAVNELIGRYRVYGTTWSTEGF